MLVNFFRMLFQRQNYFANAALVSESVTHTNVLTPAESETMRPQDSQLFEKNHADERSGLQQCLRPAKTAAHATNRNYYVASNGAVLLNNTVLYNNLTTDESEELARYHNLFFNEIGRHPEDWDELKEFIFNIQNLLY